MYIHSPPRAPASLLLPSSLFSGRATHSRGAGCGGVNNKALSTSSQAHLQGVKRPVRGLNTHTHTHTPRATDLRAGAPVSPAFIALLKCLCAKERAGPQKGRQFTTLGASSRRGEGGAGNNTFHPHVRFPCVWVESLRLPTPPHAARARATPSFGLALAWN